MAKCNWCKKEMIDNDIKSCEGNAKVRFPDGKELPSVPYDVNKVNEVLESHGYAPINPETHRCHDCGVAHSGFHHPGCDMERCPRCGGQLIGCGCLDEDEEDDE